MGDGWKRLRFAYLSVNPALRVIVMLYAGLTAIVFVQQEFLPHPYDEYRIWDFFPNWHWYWWIIAGLALLLISVLEALYQYETSERVPKPKILDHRGDAYERPRVQRGKASKYGLPALVMATLVGYWAFKFKHWHSISEMVSIVGRAALSQVTPPSSPATPMQAGTGTLADPNTAFREFGGETGSIITFACRHVIPMFPLCNGAEQCAQPVPLLVFLGPHSSQVAIKKYALGGILFVDINLGSLKPMEGFWLRGRKFGVDSPDWDVNFNDNAVEVVDESGAPIFPTDSNKP